MKNKYKIIGDAKDKRVEITVKVTRFNILKRDMITDDETPKKYIENKRQRMISGIVDGCHAALLPKFWAEQITIKEIKE